MKIKKYRWMNIPIDKSENKFARRWWQALVYRKDYIAEVYANIYEYAIPNMYIRYEVDLQIPKDISLNVMTMNIKIFTYLKLDMKRIDADIKSVVDALTK